MVKSGFWQSLDTLVREHELVIDRPHGTAHPRFPDFIYPVDYGYLRGTSSMDGGGIDVWRGSADVGVDAILVIVDMLKKDSEIKILLNCSQKEKEKILIVQNTGVMKAILINRETI